MRGTDEAAGSLFSYVDLEERVPARHPLRLIRRIVNDALAGLDAEFAALYTDFGRPSIAPERLIRASLLQILFSVRSERQLMEQMNYNLLFRWFVGLGIDDPVWVPTVFSKNRDRLLTTDMSRKVMAAILAHPEVRPLLSDEHFSVDGTLVKAWASMKSFQPKDSPAPPDDDDPGRPLPPADATSSNTDQPQQTETHPMPDAPRHTRNAEVDFRGEKRLNATHASVTDPDARLYKKSPGAAAMLCFMGHTLMENRNGLIVQADLTQRAARTRADTPALLKGLLFGPDGAAFSPTHTRKGDRLYRYYVSQTVLKHGAGSCPVGRVPAGEIETAVIDQLRAVFRRPEIVAGTWKAARTHAADITESDARELMRWMPPPDGISYAMMV